MSANNHTSKNTSTQRTDQPIDPTALPELYFGDRLWGIAQKIAGLRKVIYDDFGGGTVFGSQTSFDVNLKGAMGEVTVAKFLDDLMIEDISVMDAYGDRGWDLELEHANIEVKATGADYPVPDLIIPADPEPIADIYILTHRISERTIRLIGWTTRDRVLAQPVERKPGSKRNHIVPPEDLHFFQ